MKTRFSINVEVSENDLLEKEVQDALKAYTKSLASEAMQQEIQEEINRVSNDRMRQLTSGGWGNPPIKRMVEDSVRGSVKKEIEKSCALNEIRTQIREQVRECIHELLEEECNKTYIMNLIQSEVQQAVPKELLNVLGSMVKK